MDSWNAINFTIYCWTKHFIICMSFPGYFVCVLSWCFLPINVKMSYFTGGHCFQFPCWRGDNVPTEGDTDTWGFRVPRLYNAVWCYRDVGPFHIAWGSLRHHGLISVHWCVLFLMNKPSNWFTNASEVFLFSIVKCCDPFEMQTVVYFRLRKKET